MKPALPHLFKWSAFFVGNSSPLIEHHHVRNNIGMGQRGTFGHSRRSARIDDQREIFGGVDLYWRRLGRRVCKRVIEENVTRLVRARLGDFAEKSAEKRFERRQIGFDPADNDGLHISPFNGLDRSRIELRVIHAEHGPDSGVLELEIQLGGSVKRVACHSDRAGFEYSEEGGRVVRKIREKDPNPIPFLDASGSQKVRDPLGSFFDLRKGPGRIVEDREDLVWIIPRGIVNR